MATAPKTVQEEVEDAFVKCLTLKEIDRLMIFEFLTPLHHLVALPQPLPDVVFDLLNIATLRGWFSQLIDKAASRYPRKEILDAQKSHKAASSGSGSSGSGSSSGGSSSGGGGSSGSTSPPAPTPTSATTVAQLAQWIDKTPRGESGSETLATYAAAMRKRVEEDGARDLPIDEWMHSPSVGLRFAAIEALREKPNPGNAFLTRWLAERVLVEPPMVARAATEAIVASARLLSQLGNNWETELQAARIRDCVYDTLERLGEMRSTDELGLKLMGALWMIDDIPLPRDPEDRQ